MFEELENLAKVIECTIEELKNRMSMHIMTDQEKKRLIDRHRQFMLTFMMFWSVISSSRAAWMRQRFGGSRLLRTWRITVKLRGRYILGRWQRQWVGH
jgi:hypothetical protein